MLQRLASMDAGELRFRIAGAVRNGADRAAASITTPRWKRPRLARLLAADAPRRSHHLFEALERSARGDWLAAHHAVARHFSTRPARFPLDPQTLPSIAAAVRTRFPDAARASGARADRMLAGHYDVLGFADVPFGSPPAWHRDPVNGRETPRSFWSGIPYLDPRLGDHKIIWEINRHQHWLAFARAHHLTGDRRYYSAFVGQLEDWLAANPPLLGVNWASMLELGLRSLSWLWALHFFSPVPAAASDDVPWTIDLLAGLDRQLAHVERNLSLYFSPNTHLTGEALALYVAGLALPELRASGRWAATGRDVLLREAERQILADGGHVERSAHYHRYTTDYYLLALLSARATSDPAAGAFEDAARRLAHYLRTLADDEGRLPLLGDDDGGQLFPACGRPPWDCRDTLAVAAIVLNDPTLAVGAPPEEALWLCGPNVPAASVRPYHPPSSSLADSGYSVSRSAEGDHLVFDAGRHGFLNGGHAHADALSIVLTVRGVPLLVDAGTGTYTIDARLRDRMRTTAMHNTVVVNGRSQSEPRGSFHWQSMTDARRSIWLSNRRFDYAEGWHRGYEPLVHARGVLALHGFGWIVVDHLVGDGRAVADAHWHVHPRWTAAAAEPGAMNVRCGQHSVWFASSADLVAVPSGDGESLDAYAPIYGRIERSLCLRGRSAGATPRTMLTFITQVGDASGDAARPTVEPLPLVAPPPAGWHGAAFRIRTAGSEAMVLAAVESAGEIGAGQARPSGLWGCSEARTDGRLAFVSLGDARDPIVVCGTRVETAAPVASSVHERSALVALDAH